MSQSEAMIEMESKANYNGFVRTGDKANYSGFVNLIQIYDRELENGECEYFFDQFENIAMLANWSDEEKVTILKTKRRM